MQHHGFIFAYVNSTCIEIRPLLPVRGRRACSTPASCADDGQRWPQPEREESGETRRAREGLRCLGEGPDR
jgi:hypothetical protein